MIDEIHVQNLALIAEANLFPSQGLTVLTGETGAGKTALVSAVKLLMGHRADKNDVREGENSLVVEGRFVGDYLQGDDELVVKRTVTSDGRSRASINGNMASMKELSDNIQSRVDLCGQHEHQALMRVSSHVAMLNAWAGENAEIALHDYQEAFRAWKDAASKLKKVREVAGASNAKLDEARFILRCIDEVKPEEGELEALQESLSKAEHAEALAQAANTAYGCLSGDEGALDLLNTAASSLENASVYDEELGKYAGSIREATYVLEDIARDTRSYRDSVDFDSETLATQQERMSALLGLTRQFGPRIEDVLVKRNEAEELISMADDSAKHIAQAEKALEVAEANLQNAASYLNEAYNNAAPSFAQEVTAQMSRLEMGTAQLFCDIEALPREKWSMEGSSKIEFKFSAGSGMAPRPLTKIASGGELSRVLLAVKVVMGNKDEVDTLIFDEVDAGTGGTTAVALGEVLTDLAKTHQVIVVTHLPQIAVRGDTHYVVTKTDDDIPETKLSEVAEEAREHEIARMLSGDITETSLAHAREMLTI